MDNFIVRVKNEAERKEVQEFFFELGCEWYFSGVEFIDPLDVIICEGGLLTHCSTEYYIDCGKNHKELTIPQLRDMVVLKRNDVGDANHACETIHKKKGYLTSDNVEYFWSYADECWFISRSSFESEKLKPIEKKEMKEFLVNHNDKWTLQLLDSDTEENSFRVAVPSGATHYSKGKYSGNGVFLKVSGINQYEYYNDVWLLRCNPLNEMYFTTRLLWQRSEPKSLNDQYAKIEQVRQETAKVTIDELKHRVYKKDVSHLDSIDVYRVLELFNVQSHAVGHAIKKLLCSGGRGAKDEDQDIQEAIDSLIRYQEMKNEDE